MIYNMKKRVFSILLCMIMLFSLTSCGIPSEEVFAQVKADFEQFSPKGDVILHSSDDMVYTNDINFSVPPIDDTSYESTFIEALEAFNDKIYYLVNRFNEGPKKSGFDMSLYECDLDGENHTLLWEETSYQWPKAVFIHNILYVMYEVDDTTIVKEIDVLSKTFTTKFEGEDFDFSTLRDQKNALHSFSVAEEDGVFEITNRKTKETRTVDNDMLDKYGYLDLIEKYDGVAGRSWVKYDRIYLVYLLRTAKHELFPKGYTMLVLEYDFEVNELIFQTVLYTCDDIDGMRLEDVTAFSE